MWRRTYVESRRHVAAVNSAGGNKRTVAEAVRTLEDQRGPEVFIARFVSVRPDMAGDKVLDPSPWGTGRGTERLQPLAKVDDSERWQVSLAYVVKVMNRRKHGKLTGLTSP